jgi:hypothetical protein
MRFLKGMVMDCNTKTPISQLDILDLDTVVHPRLAKLATYHML